MGLPSKKKLIGRGLCGRCPHCGCGKLFRRWFHMLEYCPQCSLKFERIEGHWIGAIGINTIVTFGLLLIALAGGMIATFPDFPVLSLVTINVTVAIFTPIILFKISRTLWTAIDIAMRPLTSDDFKETS